MDPNFLPKNTYKGALCNCEFVLSFWKMSNPIKSKRNFFWKSIKQGNIKPQLNIFQKSGQN